ncbi:serine-rich adhesin for platelets [Periplaneta americana]|uniref:serine-rich adhesin for platelets n=1 Tax=Periplaneta americana TaxID=6978 RepID=UPI0037E91324
MSSKDNLLKQLERHSSESLSFHQQIPTEKMNNSSVTLGHIIDDSNDLIKGLSQGVVLQNGTVNNTENYGSENIMRTISSASSVPPESLKSKMDSDLDKELSKSMDAPGTSDKINIFDPTDDLLNTLSKLRGSSDVLSDPSDKILAESISRADLLDNSLDILHATESSVLKVTDPLNHSLSSDDSIIESDQIYSFNKTPHSPSNYLSHSRNLSQTTSQLTNLKESASTIDSKIGGATNLTKSSGLGNLETSGNDSKDSTQNSLNTTITYEENNPSTMTNVLHPDSELDLPTYSDTPYPDWKLDRRESGHLFWRRDSSTLNGVDPGSRVKFRYDIEVCEFETRSSEAEDLLEEDESEDDNEVEPDDEDFPILTKKEAHTDLLRGVARSEQSVSMQSRVIACAVVIVAITLVIVYRWFIGSTSVGE